MNYIDDELPSLIVFSDDWGRHPSSCQHLTNVLKGRYPVCWVNTIGTRHPRLDFATMKRAVEKIRHWSRPVSSTVASANPTVLNPRMWPSFHSRFDRWLNRNVLLRQLGPMVRSATGPVVAITTLPIMADLVGPLPVSRWVYYCVDDYEEWPGVDRSAMRSMEASLVRKADVLIAASESLQRKIAGMGRTAHLLTHGTDLDHWFRAGEGLPPGFPVDLERPWIVFWGLIDRRMDVPFLERLGRNLTRGTILLVGPESDPDTGLSRVPRLVRIPAIPYEQLPALAREAEVLVMPYADLPVTRAMQPLKLKEYLATGKPVVVRDLPATREWADCLDLADAAGSFSEAVRARLEGGLPGEQAAARRRLESEGWTDKAADFERWVLGPFLPSTVANLA